MYLRCDRVQIEFVELCSEKNLSFLCCTNRGKYTQIGLLDCLVWLYQFMLSWPVYVLSMNFFAQASLESLRRKMRSLPWYCSLTCFV